MENSTTEEPEVAVEAHCPSDREDEATLSDEELRFKHESERPDLTGLRPAVVNGLFLPRRGEYVVIERRCVSIIGRPWLDTRVYLLTADPRADGTLELYDPIRKQNARSNWLQGLALGFSFCLPPGGRNPETLFELSGGRRTSWPRAHRVKKEIPHTPAPATAPTSTGSQLLLQRERDRLSRLGIRCWLG